MSLTPALSKTLLVTVLAVSVSALAAAAAGGAEDSKSSVVAKELTLALDAAKLDSIAAADPSAPGTYVAALYFKDSQLLVVSAKYSVPVLLNDKLQKKEYRDVYVDLQAASVAGTRVFVMDQLANGLAAKSSDDNPPDTWEEGTKSVTFDGAKKAKMEDAEYDKAFASADDRYAKMLSLLLAQVKGKSGS